MLIPYDTQLLIDEHLLTVAVLTGKINLDVIEECHGHCSYMVKHGMSHAKIKERVARLKKKYKDYNFSEIVAENSEKTPEEAAIHFATQWRQSPGHWAILSSPCDIFGFSLCCYKGKNYAIGLFGRG